MATDSQPRVLSFGDFRLDCRSGELRKSKREIRLQPQPAKLLVLLATRRGEVVARAEIQKSLWGEDTFVDFEHGINFSIKQIRDALGDDVEKPLYIETVPRLGYRFIPQIHGGALVETEPENAAPSRFFRFSRGRCKIAGSVALLVGTGVLAVGLLRPPAPKRDLRMPRFQISLPRDKRIPFMNFGVLAISPDGKKVAFVGCDDSRSRINRPGCKLFLRDPTSIDALPLPGTEDAESPLFSPDGRWIAFGAKGKLKKIDLDNGNQVTLADAHAVRGGSWEDDETILFSRGGGGILRVSAAGGDVEEVTKPDPARKEYDHRWPFILPDGRKALIEVINYHGVFYPGSRGHDIALVDLENGTKRVLVESGGMPKYVDGHVIFGRDGLLFAVRVDLEKAQLIGAPAPVLEGVSMWSSPGENESFAGNVNYDISREGALIFSPREARLPRRTLVLLDRRGRQSTALSTEQAYGDPVFSPDGRRIAVAVEQDVGAWGSFVIDVASGAWTRVADGVPSTWMPDGERILLDGGPRLVSIDGSESPEMLYDMDASSATVGPDGTRCRARTGLEIEHGRPFALYRSHDERFLKLYCKAHNRLAAERVYGPEFIQRKIAASRQRASSKPITPSAGAGTALARPGSRAPFGLGRGCRERPRRRPPRSASRTPPAKETFPRTPLRRSRA